MRRLLLGILLLAGCASRSDSAVAALSRATLEVTTSPAGEPPLDGPAPVIVTLAANGRERTLPGTFAGAIGWNGGAAVLGLDRVLHRSTLDGDEILARDVVAVPAVSMDGAHLAYVVSTDGLQGELHVVDALGDRVIARELGTAAQLTFFPDARWLAFVGAALSGRAGVWIADARGGIDARCLTNCDPDARVPLPAEPFLFDAPGRLAWLDAEGQRHEVQP